MKKNILTIGIITFVSVLLFSPRARKAVCETVDTDALDKVYEMNNVLADFRKNN